MLAYRLPHTLERADAAIRGGRDPCRKAAGLRLTGAVLTDPLGRILGAFSLAPARGPLGLPPNALMNPAQRFAPARRYRPGVTHHRGSSSWPRSRS